MSGESKPTPKVLLSALRDNLSILQELANRYEVATVKRAEVRSRISCPNDAWPLVMEMTDLAQEQMRVLLLDTRNQVLGIQVVYQGNINTCIIRPAEVFRQAIIENAKTIVLVHNHPSGEYSLSKEDVKVTQQLIDVGKLLGIFVLDHLVVGKNGLISMKESVIEGLNWNQT